MNLSDFGIEEKEVEKIFNPDENLKEIAEQIKIDRNYADYVKFECLPKNFGRLSVLRNYWIFVNDRTPNQEI